jgi:hypothetical protein
MLTYDYLISFTFNKEGYLTPCTGTTQVSLRKKIKTFDDVNELISNLTKSAEGAQNLSINNIVLLGRNWH